MQTIPTTPDDEHTLALCLWREARGDGEAGMRAVAGVCLNRALSHTQKLALSGGRIFTGDRDPVYAPCTFLVSFCYFYAFYAPLESVSC